MSVSVRTAHSLLALDQLCVLLLVVPARTQERVKCQGVVEKGRVEGWWSWGKGSE